MTATGKQPETLTRAPVDYAPDLDIPGLESGLEWRPDASIDRPGISDGLRAWVLGSIGAVALWVFWPW